MRPNEYFIEKSKLLANDWPTDCWKFLHILINKFINWLITCSIVNELSKQNLTLIKDLPKWYTILFRMLLKRSTIQIATKIFLIIFFKAIIYTLYMLET